MDALSNIHITLAETIHKIITNPWYLVGFAGQFFFMMRFVVQWLSSEKQRRSTIPHAFWFFSILGGSILLTYAIWQKDPVFIAGQALGMTIYLRNLYFIYWVNRSHMISQDMAHVRNLSERLTKKIHKSKDLKADHEILSKMAHELAGLIEEAGKTNSASPPPPPPPPSSPSS